MRGRFYFGVTMATAAACLACGGIGSVVDAGPAHGSIAFHTYSTGSETLRFRSDDTVEKTWRAMAGDAVPGSYTHVGDEIVIKFDLSHQHNHVDELRLRQLDPCSLAGYYFTLRDGTVRDDDSKMYTRTQPKCPR